MDRPETEIDRPEAVSQSRPTGIVLRWQSRAIRSEVIVSAEIHPERAGVAPRPEPETAQPEVEFAPVAGPSTDPTAVGTSLTGPPTRCRTEIFPKPIGLSIFGLTGTGNSTNILYTLPPLSNRWIFQLPVIETESDLGIRQRERK